MTAAGPATESIAPARLLWTFLRVGMLSVGGGGVAHVQAAVVERERWLSQKDFIEALTVARTLPGMNVCNLASFIGSMLAGRRGSACALLGVVSPGALFVVLAATAYLRIGALHTRVFQGFLSGLIAGAVGVMGTLVWKTARAGLRGIVPIVVAGLAIMATLVLHLNMAIVLVALVPIAATLERTA